MFTKSSLVLIIVCICATTCFKQDKGGKILHKKKVAKKIRKLSNLRGNVTKEDNRRSYNSFSTSPSYSPTYDYQSPASPTSEEDTRSLDIFGFLNGASISSHLSLHLPIPLCQFTDMCKNYSYQYSILNAHSCLLIILFINLQAAPWT